MGMMVLLLCLACSPATVEHSLGPPRRAVNPSYTPTVAVTYGPTGTEFTASGCAVDADSNKEIRCNTAPGAGAGHVWRVTVDGATGTSGQLRTSYARPTITTVSGGPLATAGGTTVTITGTNFGPEETVVSATYGDAGYVVSTRMRMRVCCVSLAARVAWTVCRCAMHAARC